RDPFVTFLHRCREWTSIVLRRGSSYQSGVSRCARGFGVAQIASSKRKFRRGRERRPNAAPGTRRKTFADIRAQRRALPAAFAQSRSVRCVRRSELLLAFEKASQLLASRRMP